MARHNLAKLKEELKKCGGIEALLRTQPANRAFKDAAKHFALLSKPVRLQILLLLRDGELCVCVIKTVISCPDSRLSYHLASLKRAGLIRSRRDHSFLRYTLTEKGLSVVDEVLQMLGSE